MTMTYRGTTALITGASSGLGVEFATRFAERGADVVLVARREDRLRQLAMALERDHKVGATVVPLDLTTPDAVQAVRAALAGRGIHTLINNAGFGMRGAFVNEDPARVESLLQLNVLALTRLTREFLPDLIRRGEGALVNIASTAAYQPLPNMAIYGASKAYVLSFTEAIAYETRESGLSVLALSPGATSTEFFDVVGSEDAAVGRFQSSEQVVATALKAIDRSHTPPSIVSGVRNGILAKAAGIVPRRLSLAATGRLLT
ncbi:SDR family NAD(P)-dependent oxidoreductase [Microbacterium sp. DT81.1]|uniref:SDR family NAD(P)-dependent oxidoreductase n=1 Tax=Microbacterium sp. DT81.1 TaxID=3393413 RepID=UPI003CEF4BE7